MSRPTTAATGRLDGMTALHLVGVGGAGMSGLARLALARGLKVTGSDRHDGPQLAALRALGADVWAGHAADRLPDCDLVVASTAIRPDNAELAAAARRGVPVWRRAELLAALMDGRRGIAVAGTHGKTTTTGMLVGIMTAGGLDPSFAVGGDLALAAGGERVNAAAGAGPHFIAEADESDGSFLLLDPEIAVVTNVEADHLDHYGDLAAVEAAFRSFAGRMPAAGTLVLCADDPGAAALGSAASCHVVTYSVDGDAAADVRAVGLRPAATGVTFTLERGQETLGPVTLPRSGRHAVANAVAAAAAALAAGASFPAVQRGLAAYGGVDRRFARRGEAGGVTVIDDYAHHPTEVAATLAEARAGTWQRVVAVFQPHLYSRTATFAAAFGAALATADVVVVADVYAAREDPLPGVTGELVAAAARSSRPGLDVAYVPDRARLAAEVATLAGPGDLVLTLGAGDITGLAAELLPLLAGPPAAACGQQLSTGGIDSYRPPWGGGWRPPGRPLSAAVRLLGAAGSQTALAAAPDTLEAFARALAAACPDRVRRDAPLAPLTTFRLGGPAAVLLRAETLDDLAALATTIQQVPVPLLIFGKGSNLLVADDGWPGVAVHLGNGFRGTEQDGDHLEAGAATPMPALASRTAAASLGGLSFAVAIPGTVGGGVRMNAGAHGTEVADRLVWAEVVGLLDGADAPRRLTPAELGLAYRRSALPPGSVVTRARFALHPAAEADVRAEIDEARQWRRAHQPVNEPNCGSVFANPDGQAAGQVVESLGMKGETAGGAAVSDVHANFIVARAGASSGDVLTLIRRAQRRALDELGVRLRTEVQIVGAFPDTAGADAPEPREGGPPP